MVLVFSPMPTIQYPDKRYSYRRAGVIGILKSRKILLPSPYPRRGLGRGLTGAHHYCLGGGKSVASVLALNLSRRDRNRADLSSDK